MPAYHCGAEVDAVLSTGASVALYRVGRDMRIDVRDLRDRISERTRVVYVIHYFGWPQELGELSRLCRDRGIRLLEDCALALFSRCGTRNPEAVSDASVFSFSKTLAVTDGGAAVWHTLHEAPADLCGPGTCAVLRRMLPLIKRTTLRRMSRMGLPGILLGAGGRTGSHAAQGPQDEMPQNYYFTDSVRGVSLSRCARGSAHRTDRDQIIARRRRNFLRLLDRLLATGAALPLQSLPDGVCPLAMPITVENRNEVIRSLTGSGVEAIPWWAGGHRSLGLQGFPEAKLLKEQVVALPVHQQLTDADIDFVADAADAALGQLGRADAGPVLSVG